MQTLHEMNLRILFSLMLLVVLIGNSYGQDVPAHTSHLQQCFPGAGDRKYRRWHQELYDAGAGYQGRENNGS